MPSDNLTHFGEEEEEQEQTVPLSSKKHSAIQIVKLRRKSNSTKNSTSKKIQKFIKARLPILKWIGDYNFSWGLSDFIAGITLGLTIIPESIACALLAGLPAHYGLCSAFIGSFIYLIFGTIHKVIMGPTSLVALVSVQFTIGKPIEFAFLLTFFSGVVEIILGCLQMGFIFEFISLPVIKAFSTATAVLVIESQLKVLLGIKYLAAGFVQSLHTLSTRIDEANAGDLIMGLSAITFLFTLDLMAKFSSKFNLKDYQRKILIYVGFSRNTLLVIITATFTYFRLQHVANVPYALSKSTLSGLPNFSWPQMTIETETRFYTLQDILRDLNVGIIVTPIIGILTNFSIGKITPKNEVNANQELVTVGICNVFGACVQSMPTSGAFSRCAISTACGLRTPMANLYSGIIVLLALSYLSPYFNFIPKATLAAILICSIYTLIDFQLPFRLWFESRREFFVWLICFFVCLCFGVEVGLFVSIIITVLHLIFIWARPQMNMQIEELANIQYLRIIPATAVYFPATAYLRAKILKFCVHLQPCSSTLVIDCTKVFDLDYTAAQSLLKLSHELCAANGGEHNFFIIFFRLNEKLQKLIEPSAQIFVCHNDEELHECILSLNLKNSDEKIKEEMFNFQIDTEAD